MWLALRCLNINVLNNRNGVRLLLLNADFSAPITQDNSIMKSFFSFTLFSLALCLAMFTSCEKELVTVSPINNQLDDLAPGTEIRLDKPQIDALLMAEYGRVAVDAEEKFTQLSELMASKLGLNVKPSGTDKSLTGCLLITSESNGETRRLIEGKVCDDNDLLLTTFQFYRFLDMETFEVGEDGDQDGEVFIVTVDNSGAATTFETTREFLLFSGLTGIISETDGTNGDGIITRQFSRSNVFCDPDDFGDGLWLSTKVGLRDRNLTDGLIDFEIDLRVRCKD
jgi:hypothetical protein